MSLGRFLVQTLRPDATMPSPHTDGQHRRKSQQDGETKPALCPVHICHDGFDLICEEVGQTEPQRDAEPGAACVRYDELPERHARNARRQKRSGTEPHDVPRRDDRLQCMPSIRCLEPLLARGRQYEPDHSPVEKLLTPVPADPVEHHIAGEHPQQTEGERKPPPDDAFVAQHGGRDDRHFLRDWYPQAAEYEHGENAEVRKVVDELLECLHGVLAGPNDATRAPALPQSSRPPTRYAAWPV